MEDALRFCKASLSRGMLLFAVTLGVWDVEGSFSQGPQSGDVFREYVVSMVSNEKNPSLRMNKKGAPEVRSAEMVFRIGDLEHAIRAEASINYWGGHIGTSRQRMILNNYTTEAIHFALPENTPSKPECYYRTMLGLTSVPVPLHQLKDGENKYYFVCNTPLKCRGSFNWPAMRVYSFTIRVYYDSSKKPHCTGTIASPTANASIGDNHAFTANVQTASGVTVASVDYMGEYEDFDWEGNGLFRQWHVRVRYGEWAYHVGTAKSGASFPVSWSTTWLPDQEKPMRFMARVKSSNGICYMTPTIGGVLLQRPWSVRMGKPFGIPEKFGVRINQKQACRINLPDHLDQAKEARLLFSSWSADHPKEPGSIVNIDGQKLAQKFGEHHTYSYDSFDLPLSHLKPGRKSIEFQITSSTKEHMFEINWPGPVVLVRYGKSLPIAISSATPVRADGVFPGSILFRDGALRASLFGSGDYEMTVYDASGRVLQFHAGQGPLMEQAFELHGPSSGMLVTAFTYGPNRIVKRFLRLK